MVYAVGTKGRDSVEREGYTIAGDYSEAIDEPLYADASEIGKEVSSKFTMGEIGEIYLIYTIFKNTMVQIPTMMKLLPIDASDITADAEDVEENPIDRITLMNYEPAPEEALNASISKVCEQPDLWRTLWSHMPVKTVHVCRQWIRQRVMRKR